ncbi:DeoR/GlpR family DNA-binding transcription regulator [Trujillonella humicola]|uniref:DeoR/GlpR family DNA-binding transcription regulator n=1 Tax=Trujillonella humicola TaxID=3383699 RepID=UPI003905D081
MVLPDRLDVTLRLVRNRGRVSLADLAARLGVSEMTVRRDLDALQARGLVERVRGGAVAVAQPESAAGFAARAGWQTGVKDRLGRVVAGLVQPGSTVLLDAGTTTVHVARALAGRAATGDCPLTVAALSLPVAAALADRPGVRLLVVGGESRPGEQSLSGPLTASVLRQLTFDLFVMSIGAVSAEAGWSEFTLEDAAVKQAGLASARSTLVVADAAKLGVRAFAAVAPLAAVGRLVTDPSARDPQLSPAAQDTLAALESAGVEVVSS